MLGFDACLDHGSPDLGSRLAATCPDGIDVYFENVGGSVLDAVLPLLNLYACVPLCGFIAHYNRDHLEPVAGDQRPQLLATLLQKRVRMQGSSSSTTMPTVSRRFSATCRSGWKTDALYSWRM